MGSRQNHPERSLIFEHFSHHRDALWKFFLPADYQAIKVTEESQPGKLRQILAFELRMNIIDNATIDLLFTKNRVHTHDQPLYVLLYKVIHICFSDPWFC